MEGFSSLLAGHGIDAKIGVGLQVIGAFAAFIVSVSDSFRERFLQQAWTAYAYLGAIYIVLSLVVTGMVVYVEWEAISNNGIILIFAMFIVVIGVSVLLIISFDDPKEKPKVSRIPVPTQDRANMIGFFCIAVGGLLQILL
jgi:hypothetical protein